MLRDFIAHMIYLTIVFLLRVCSRMLCAQWTCHIPWTHLSRIPASRITCHQLVYSYVSVPIHVFSYLYQYGLSTRPLTFLDYTFLFLSCRLVSLHFSLMPVSFCSLSTRLSSCYFWTMTHSTFYEHLYFYLADCYIYRLEMWVIPHLQSTLQPP